MIDVDDLAADRPKSHARGQPGLRRPAQDASRTLALFPGDAAPARRRRAGANLKSGGQRFVLDLRAARRLPRLHDRGLRAKVGFDFDVKGKFVGTAGRPRPARGAEYAPPSRPMAFRRALGTFDATMLVVGGIIGAGIFVNPYLVAQRLPSAGLDPRGLDRRRRDRAGRRLRLRRARGRSSRRPGGEYVYLREAYHPLVALPLRLGLASHDPGRRPRRGRDHVLAVRPAASPGRRGADPTPLAIAAIAVVALVNVAGVKPGSRLLNVLVLLKIVALAVLILRRPLARAATRRAPPPLATVDAPRRHAARLRRRARPDPLLVRRLAERQPAGGGDPRAPRAPCRARSSPGRCLVIVVYVLVNVVYLVTLGARRPRGDGHARRRRRAPPLRARARTRWITAAIAVSTFGFLDLTLLGPTRIYYAMARDGVFFRSLGAAPPALRDAAPGDPAAGRSGRSSWC